MLASVQQSFIVPPASSQPVTGNQQSMRPGHMSMQQRMHRGASQIQPRTATRGGETSVPTQMHGVKIAWTPNLNPRASLTSQKEYRTNMSLIDMQQYQNAVQRASLPRRVTPSMPSTGRGDSEAMARFK